MEGQNVETKHTSAPNVYIVLHTNTVKDNHIPNCSIHKPQVVTFPEGEDAVLYYKATQKEFPVPYVIYCDFESFFNTVRGQEFRQPARSVRLLLFKSVKIRRGNIRALRV